MNGKKIPEARRLSYLDGARGLGILLVVLGHIWEEGHPVVTLIYSFHVPLFFLISGILMKHTGIASRPWRDILQSRIRGLVVPYLFFEAVYILIFGIRNGFDFGEQHLYSAFLMQPLNVPIWFLVTLFASELLVILLIRITKEKQLIMALLCAVLYLIPFAVRSTAMIQCLMDWGVCADGQVWLAEVEKIAPVLRCFTAVGFLAAGYFGSEWIRRTDVPAAALLIGLFADVILTYYNGKMGIYKQTFGNPILFTICGLLGSLTVIFLLKKLRIRPLEILGTHSITVLGLHIIVLRVLQEMIGLDTDSSIGGMIALALICGVLTAAGSVLEQFAPWIVGKKRSIVR